jgi:large subunit ribosomal protein L21
MYAVIKTGGKQYKVSEGDVLEIEHLKLKSDTTRLTPVLVVDDQGKTIFGPKDLAGYKVGVKVLGDAKGDKVTVFKYRPKSGYASKTGHRQLYSLIEITSIGKEEPSKAKDGTGAKAKPRSISDEAEPPATKTPQAEAPQAEAPQAEAPQLEAPQPEPTAAAARPATSSEGQRESKRPKAAAKPRESGSQPDNLKSNGT